MPVFTASTTAQLMNYLASAKAGDTIELTAGTYSGVTVANLALSGVTVTSADPTNPAVLTDLMIKYSSGVTFSNLEMSVTKDVPFQVVSSSNITLDNLDIHGSLDGTSNDDFRGMSIRDSTYVTVSNSHFHELTDALTHINADYATFTNNTFDTIRDNGICGGGSSFITVSDNVFSDFDHVGAIHPDAIQFWTANTTTAATDITITGNVFNRGTGVAIQGIWISDDVGTLPFQHVTVSDNVIVGAMYHGISISGATDAIVSNNSVIGEVGQNSWIGIFNVVKATLNDNVATDYQFVNSGVTGHGDVLTSFLSLPDASTVSTWLDTNAVAGQLDTINTQFESVVLPDVNLIGFTDGPSTTGQNYSFGVVNFYGTTGADRLVAGAFGSSHLYGYDGNDMLIGGKNGISSTLEGGLGDDSYSVYQANDIVLENAGAGLDTVYAYVNYTLTANVENLRAGAGGLTLHGNSLDNSMAAAAGGDTLYGDLGNDTIQGAAGIDKLYGGDGTDRLFGYDGNDTLDGGNGDDSLYGGNGNDIISGGTGNDIIEGGVGLDKLTGGLGADQFIFRPADFTAGVTVSKDIITDFSLAQGDKIILNALDANSKVTGDQAFAFIGNAAFHGVAGELRYVAETDGITVYGDTNGDKIADVGIHLVGLTSITSSAFQL